MAPVNVTSSAAVVDEALALARAGDASGADLEIICLESDSRTVGWADGRPLLNNVASSRGACVRALVAGGQGLATTTVADPRSIARVAKQAIVAAAATAKDPNRRLAEPSQKIAPPIASDENVFTRPADEILADLAAVEKRVLVRDSRLRKIVRLAVSESRQSRAIGNTRGVRLSDTSTSAAFSIELLAADGTSTEAAWDYKASRFSGRLDLDHFVASVADDALRALGGKPLSTGVYPVVLAPRVGTQLLDLVGGALSAEAVQHERSFLKGLVGKKVASDLFTLHDDPLLPEGLASDAFDDEGMPHGAIAPIQSGVLRDYFYDLRSAARDGRESNGRASKGGLGAAPHPSATNLFIGAGTTSVNDMLSSGAKVFVLREVMGLHMADPITGEFSLGGSGYLYENGRFASAVRGVTIAGSVGGVLQGVTAVGPDLTWYGSVGAPSLLVTGLTVAGS